MKIKEWFVTVYGELNGVSNPQVFVSNVIKLPEDKTPIDWFISKPTLYHRTDFKPIALLNWCEMKNKMKTTKG